VAKVTPPVTLPMSLIVGIVVSLLVLTLPAKVGGDHRAVRTSRATEQPLPQEQEGAVEQHEQQEEKNEQQQQQQQRQQQQQQQQQQPSQSGAPEAGGNGAAGSRLFVASREELLELLREEKERQRLPVGDEGTIKKTFIDPVMGLMSSDLKPVIGGEDHSGSGIVLGLAWTKEAVGHRYIQEAAPNRIDLKLRATGSNYAYADALARMDVRNLGGLPFSVAFEGEYKRHPREPFFGIGQGSLLENRTTYRFESSRAGATLWWDAPKGFRVGSAVDVIGMSQGAGNDNDYPTTGRLFTAEALPGLGSAPTFFRFGGFADFDWRDAEDYPQAGGYYALRIYDYNDSNLDSFDFRSYEIEAQQYFPFLHKHRVIALRFLGELTNADNPDRVPFFLWPTLGGGKDLRGFRTFRFRDFNKMLMQAEYRWKAWMGLDMALFFDAGKVFPHRGGFDFDDLETAYGIGFRFNTGEALFLRADIAYSSEGLKPHFSLSHVF